MWHANTILYLTDFTDPTESAYRTACELAREKNAHLIALHVAPKPVVAYLKRASELSPEASREKIWEAIRRPRQEESGVNVEHRLEEGDPITEILRVVTETHCDLIVMGTHGRTGLTRWFSGSITEDLIRRSPCSVLVVKTPSVVAPKSTEAVASKDVVASPLS